MIFVVDDDASVRLMVVGLLEALDHQNVRAFSCPYDALEAMDRGDVPRTVITDLMMPTVDGATFVRVLRERGFGGKVIMLTGGGELFPQAQQLFEEGHTDHLIMKPFTLASLSGGLTHHREPLAA